MSAGSSYSPGTPTAGGNAVEGSTDAGGGGGGPSIVMPEHDEDARAAALRALGDQH